MTAQGEDSAARQQVDEYVRSGRWPDPNTRTCMDCGHVWFRGERRHHYDVDHLDRLVEDPEDVHVVCVLCRQQRGLARDEDVAPSTHWHW